MIALGNKPHYSMQDFLKNKIFWFFSFVKTFLSPAKNNIIDFHEEQLMIRMIENSVMNNGNWLCYFNRMITV